MATTIVIGAGQAGAEVASRLRDEGYEAVSSWLVKKIISLSKTSSFKKYMAGEIALERLFLRPEEFYHKENIELHIGKMLSK